jgi:hypothetical protein
MTRGGYRTGAGRRPDENSARSDKRGFKLDELPAEAYAGKVPAFPLLEPSAREREVWREVWRLPQAHAWSRPEQAWRLRSIAMYVRQSVKCEAPDIGASHLAQLHRFADQIGMTDAGLAAMGFKVVAAPQPTTQTSGRKSSRDRLRAVAPLDSQETPA